jgi:hypothetical protein
LDLFHQIQLVYRYQTQVPKGKLQLPVHQKQQNQIVQQQMMKEIN